jgi:hypothetical protein
MDATRPHSAPSSSLQLVDNQPNPHRTIEALREMGYDSHASVLELIDNSIDAQANGIQVKVVEQGADIVISIEVRVANVPIMSNGPMILQSSCY